MFCWGGWGEKIQNSKQTGGSDLNSAPAIQFAAIRVVFQNVVPPFDSDERTFGHETVRTGKNSENNKETDKPVFHAV